MRNTRKGTAIKQAAMSEVSRELGVENTALAKTIEEIMAKYFRDADEKSEARNNRLEKRLDNMHATLARHTDELKTLRSDTLQLQERVSQTEAHLQALVDKTTEMEDRARRDNLLIFNLKEGVEGSNMMSYLMENIPRWFPVFTAAHPPEIMRAHRLGPPRTAPAPGRGQRARPVILKLLRYTDRDVLLREARKKNPEVAGIQLTWAADYSETTSKRRKPCYKIMHEARIQGFTAFLMYPATIKLQRGGDSFIFKEPVSKLGLIGYY
ncbi:hypothetical protein WMY93_021441 [Mugilogobius chulae]|uniref:L1 transposable element RRM domain-containing protein n=1 Tax=Mugilogobius chulae TaxID=88201 RepID=A0AAW0NGI2_9GOBI